MTTRNWKPDLDASLQPCWSLFDQIAIAIVGVPLVMVVVILVAMRG